MTATNKHFGLKLVAIALVVTIFATLLPQRQVFWAEGTDAPQMFSTDAGLDFTESIDPYNGQEQTDRSDTFDKYEQAALKELGKPAVIENIDPYRRSDVTYEIRDIANAFTRNYALDSGNYTRLIFGSPVNYKTSDGQWRKIDLSLQKEATYYQTKDTPYWNVLDGTAITWKLGGIKDYYNTDTVYFAVER